MEAQEGISSNKKSIRTNKLLLVFVFLFLCIVFFGTYLVTQINRANKNNLQKQTQHKNNANDVLGRNTVAPQIYISGGNQGFTSGGVIALASTDAPTIQLGGYDISGIAKIAIYKANENVLLDYLIHDKDSNQIKKKPDTNSLQYVTTVSHDIAINNYDGTTIPLPLEETGIWYLDITLGSKSVDAYVIRSNVGVLTQEGDNEFIFWGQNFKTKRSIGNGTIKIYNLQDERKELQTVTFNADGIAKASINGEADIALVEQQDDRALIPINLLYLNTGNTYRQFEPKSNLQKPYTVFQTAAHFLNHHKNNHYKFLRMQFQQGLYNGHHHHFVILL